MSVQLGMIATAHSIGKYLVKRQRSFVIRVLRECQPSFHEAEVISCEPNYTF